MKKTQTVALTAATGVLVMFLMIGLMCRENAYAQKGTVAYTCPMPEHADVMSDKPGKCPKCGMVLVPKAESPAQYTCPMKEHSDVVMDKPGKCPKCGMNLVPMKKEIK